MLEQVLQKFFSTKTRNLIRFETATLLILGVLTILFAQEMLGVFNYFFAVAAITYGIFELCYFAKTSPDVTPATDWVPFMVSMSAVSIGVIMFIDGHQYVKVFLGVWLITFGIFQIVRVIKQHKTLSFWGLTLLCGVASIFFSSVILFNWPVSGVDNVGYFIGPNLIIAGITIWFNNRTVFKQNSTSKKSSSSTKKSS